MNIKEQLLKDLEKALLDESTELYTLNYFKSLFDEIEVENTTRIKELLMLIFQKLEFQDSIDLVEKTYNDTEFLKKVLEMYVLKVKSVVKQLKNMEDEREDLFDRKDMIEFAEYVARLYNLRNNDWTEIDQTEPLEITVSKILNDFEVDRQIQKEVELKKNKDGVELGRYIYG